MVRFLWTTLIYLLSSAVGILVANWILDDMSVSAAAFVWAVVIFTAVQAIITPFLFKVVRRNASALIGAVGLLSTFIALLVAHWLTDGLVITGTATWLWATLIVWLVTMLATLLLPLFIAKKALGGKVGGNNPTV
jgi:hypothetical protein